MVSRYPRRVCVFTGSRADYAPLSPLLRRLRDDTDIELRLLVSGGHLVPEQGFTVREIEADALSTDERVDVVLAGDTSTAVAKSFGLACIGYADAYQRIEPDIVVVLGDRYEALAAAIVALHKDIIIAHIGGGQLSYGSIDNQMRHAISKLAHLHFTIDPSDSTRLIQIGEDASRIFHVGVISVDSVVASQLLDRASVGLEIGIELTSPTFVVTYHPATSDPSGSNKAIEGPLGALEEFPDATVIITSPNVDTGSKSITASLRKYADRRAQRVRFIESLGRKLYLSLVKNADAVIGNSSSGIHEAPALGTPTVNIGSRQDGRSKPRSVIDCDESRESIVEAVRMTLSEQRDRRKLTCFDSIDRSIGCVIDTLKNSALEDLRRK